MSNYKRPDVTGACVFFTVALAQRGSRLLVDEVDRLRDAVRETRQELPFEIHAWVVLPDHIHAIWQLPAGDRGYGVRWGAIKSRFSRSYLRSKGWPKCRVGFHPTDGVITRSPSKAKKGDAGIWQRRFWEHHIRDRADYDNHVRYCHLNPVKHGLVDRPEEWAYSSIHREIAAGRWPLVDGGVKPHPTISMAAAPID